jgi:hypothetical protein
MIDSKFHGGHIRAHATEMFRQMSFIKVASLVEAMRDLLDAKRKHQTDNLHRNLGTFTSTHKTEPYPPS